MKRNLITLHDITAEDIFQIFELADNANSLAFSSDANLTACYSFEGNSLRTRATFVKALFDLGISPIELPNLLKTGEAVEHLAGYLDYWFDLYVIRDRNHNRLAQFAGVSEKPVINALSSGAHPCEVLADAYAVIKGKGALDNLKYCILGPPTNVLNSWIRICQILELDYVHVIPQGFEAVEGSNLTHTKSTGLRDAHVVLTDAWPKSFDDRDFQLTLEDLKIAQPDAWVIPCPPFSVENEVHQDVIDSDYFAGYAQKRYLYEVQKALIYYLVY